MRIGISCYPTFGGSGVIASELGMGLAERGHEVHFITYAVPGRLKVYQPGIHYHEVSVPDYPLFEYPPYSLALASHMVQCAKYEKLEIIHSHYAIPHAASALIARDMMDGELRVVATLHGTDITLVGRDQSFLPVTKHAIEQSDAVSAVSMYLHDEICCIFTCERTVNVIYNFIDPRTYENLDSAELHRQFAPNGEKLLVHVSNFRPVKRVRDVMDIFLRVREKMPVKLILIGTGPDLACMDQLARRAGAERDLIVLGVRESIAEVVSAADLFLLPSETESFGLAALEAMACGTPAVVSDAGGLPEVVQHGETGCLAPVGNTELMSEYALELLEDRHKLEKMSDQARRTAFDRFNIEQALDRYEELYLEALD